MKKTQQEFTAAVWRRVEEKREEEKKRARTVRRVSVFLSSAACLALIVGAIFPILRSPQKRTNDDTAAEAVFDTSLSQKSGDNAPEDRCNDEQTGRKTPLADGPQAAPPLPAEASPGEKKGNDTGAPESPVEGKAPELSLPRSLTVLYGSAGSVTDGAGRSVVLTDPGEIARLLSRLGGLSATRIREDPADPGAADISVLWEENGKEEHVVLFSGEHRMTVNGKCYRIDDAAAEQALTDLLQSLLDR